MPMRSGIFGGILLVGVYSASVAFGQQPSASSSAQTSAAMQEIPTPSGPFGIGRIGFHWIDTSRPDKYDPKRHRELMVYFWYPTAKSAGAKGQYLPGAVQMDAQPEIRKLMSHEVGNNWAPFSDWPLLFHGQDGFPETPLVLHNLDLITQFIRAFLDKTLLGEKQPLFDGRSSLIPEASVTAYGR